MKHKVTPIIAHLDGQWHLYLAGRNIWHPIHSFIRADEARGVRELVIEYIERHDYDPERACAQAMIEYREALAAEEDGWDALGYVG